LAFYNTMGTPNAGTIVRGNAQVDIQVPNSGGVVSEPLDFRNGPDSRIAFTTLDTLAPVNVLSAIALNGTHTFFPGDETHLKGIVSGPGRLILDPEGFSSPPLPAFSLENSSNTFSGGVEIRAYTTLRAAVAGALPAAGELAIASSGTVQLDASQAVSSITCNGSLAITVPASLRVAHLSDIHGCALKLTVPPGYDPGGAPIVIVSNASGSAAGTFIALPEGSPFNVAGAPYSLSYHGGAGNDIVLAPASDFTLPSVQDMWWAGPSENGWGMSLVEHNDTLFGAFYIYDANGKPTWVVMPGGAWDAGHVSYTGSLYEPAGSPFYAYDVSSFIVAGSVGSVSITFQDANDAILDYSIGGVTGRKFVTREIFASGDATPPVRSDLWWGGASQNGWGITVLQQANTLFAVWYTYDASGNRTWYVMPGGAWTASDTYEGALYRTTGSPWVGKSYDPSKLQVFSAGTYKFQFNGDAATFTYSADGHSGSIALVREPF
jgi:hypothetical protein